MIDESMQWVDELEGRSMRWSTISAAQILSVSKILWSLCSASEGLALTTAFQKQNVSPVSEMNQGSKS